LAGMKTKEVRNVATRMPKIECPHCGNTIALQVTKVESKIVEKSVPLIDMVKSTTRKWSKEIDVIDQNEVVIVKPKGYLGKDVWQQINDSLKPFEPEWVSEGKESRWAIQRRESQ
jgi:hypothetical protein